jgi:predicted AAA+ superfamily ATPase
MIRRDLTERLQKAARSLPVVTVTGPRQSGKTTLCREVFSEHPYVSLEAPDVRALALADPRAFLAQFPAGAVLDEVQRCPELPSYLQGLVDDDPTPGRWILTGSQNLLLLESVSQSLAGRASIQHLLPLTRNEVTRFPVYPTTLDETLLAGSYPRILDRQMDPSEFLDPYLTAYVERDVRTVTNVGDLVAFQRFLGLCAGRTAQVLNISTLATDAGLSQPTAKAWLSILETGFIVFRLPAFAGSPRKRLVKMTKLHFYDTGLVCRLLGIRNVEQLRLHPLRGAIFETWVASEIRKYRMHHGEINNLSHYRDLRGAEVDLVVEHPTAPMLVESKAGQTIHHDMFGGLLKVKETLKTPQPVVAWLVHGGSGEIESRRGVGVIPWNHKSLHERIAILRESDAIEIATGLGFLHLFNQQNQSDYRIVDVPGARDESPDLRCENSAGEELLLEITLLDGRMAERMIDKMKKRYGPRTALVVRHASGWDPDWDWVLEDLRKALPIETNPFDRGIWIMSNDKTRLFCVTSPEP